VLDVVQVVPDYRVVHADHHLELRRGEVERLVVPDVRREDDNDCPRLRRRGGS